MGFELYYTSAVEGVKRGSGGFCTVGASEEMPRGLWERLESLSAYRHVEGAGSGGNPVGYAHWVVNVAGVNYHVLSRACDAGVDHTQRPNAFAHHVVVGAREMARGGPAWMLQQAGVMKEGWDGTVGAIGPRVLPMGGGNEGGVCRRWKEVTGDAGWGGRLADLYVAGGGGTAGGGTPVCVVFGPGQEMLGLMGEAIALLPAEMRWGVTFHTYFQTMPTSATCLWRCCLAGTPAAQSGMRYAANGGLVLDLTKPLGAAPGGAFVEYARTGRGRPAVGGGAKKAVGVVVAAAASAPVAEREEIVPEEEAAAAEEEATPLPAEEEVVPVVPVRRRAKKVEVGMLEEITGRASGIAEARRRRQVVGLFVAALGAIGLGMGMVWWAYHGNGPGDLPEPVATRKVAASVPAERVERVEPREPVVVGPQVAPATGAGTLPRMVLAGEMAAPAAGSGMHDPDQEWTVPGGKLEGVEVALVGGSPFVAKGARGTMRTVSQEKAVLVKWQDADSPEGTAWTAATVRGSGDKVSVEWNAGFLLTHPEAAGTVYWRLRGGTVAGMSGGRGVVALGFEPWKAGAVDFVEETAALKPPVALPEGATVVIGGLPKGWKQAVSEGGGAATQPGVAGSVVVEISRPGEDAEATPAFELIFREGFGEVVSTFAEKRATALAELNVAEEEAKGVDGELAGALGPARDELERKKARLLERAARYNQAIDGYKQLEQFEAAVMVSGVRVGTIGLGRSARGASETLPGAK